MDDISPEIKAEVEKKSVPELIRELIKSLNKPDLQLLEVHLKSLDRSVIVDAVCLIRTANNSKRPNPYNPGFAPSIVYTMLGLSLPDESFRLDSNETGAAAASNRVSVSADKAEDILHNAQAATTTTDKNITQNLTLPAGSIDATQLLQMFMQETTKTNRMMERLIDRVLEKSDSAGSVSGDNSLLLLDDKSTSKITKEIYRSLGKMPNDSSKIPEYFDVLEAYLKQMEVDNTHEQWIDILKGLMGFHGNKITLGLNLSHNTYSACKQAIFSHYGISANLYYERFYTDVKARETTYKAFVESLSENLTRYLEFSKTKRTYEALFDKLLYDRLKSVIPDSIVSLVNQWEFKTPMNARELAQFADQMSIDAQKFKLVGTVRKFCYKCKKSNHSTEEHRDDYVYKSKTVINNGNIDNVNKIFQDPMGRNMTKAEWEEKCKNEKLCIGCGEKYDQSHKRCLKRKQYTKDNEGGFWYNVETRNKDTQQGLKNNNKEEKEVLRSNRVAVKQKASVITEVPEIEQETKENKVINSNHDSSTNEMKKILNKVCLLIDGIPVKGIVDSGTDITVLSSNIHPQFQHNQGVTQIILESAFGDSRSASLRTCSVSLYDEEQKQVNPLPVALTVAVCPDLKTEHLLLSLADYLVLKNAYSDTVEQSLMIVSQDSMKEEISCKLPALEYSCSCADVNNFCDSCQYLKFVSKGQNKSSMEEKQINRHINYIEQSISESVDNKLIDDEFEIEDTNSTDGLYVAEERTNSEMVEAKTLAKEQEDDKTLMALIELAKKGDKKFYIQEMTNVLYRKSYYRNIERDQVVLPSQRRATVLSQAHDTLFGGHFGAKRTRAKIEAYFWWPQIIKDVQHYVRSCEVCQRKRTSSVKDKIPIKFIQRDSQAFDTLFADVLGPLEESSQHHKYCLTVVDQYSRFPFAFPLKSLKPQEICQCLITIFCTFGLPNQIFTDQGTNFCSELNSEFAKLFGFTHTLCTPYRKEPTGLAERHNANIEKLLHQILISNKSRSWATLCPIISWSLRDTVNETTGLTPFEMVFGHNARSPLALLKTNWDGENLSKLKKPYKEYMLELNKNLDAVKEIAEINCEKTQPRYEEHSNRSKIYKEFNVGDRVVVLIPNSTFKIRSQWGVGSVIEKLEHDSYRIQMDETGQIRILHADKLRKFYSRVQHLGMLVVQEDDFMSNGVKEEILEISKSIGSTESNSTANIEDNLSAILQQSHLDCSEQSKLRAVLEKHKKLFEEKIGTCDVCEHTIDMMPEFVPKQFVAYRFPQKLIPEIENKILEMEKEGKIVRSKSKMVSPMLVVAKPTGGIRIVVDYRYVNQFTEPQGFPMPRIDDMLHRIASSSYITCIDVSSAYHTIPLRKSDRYLTAFVCHLGIFEYTVAPMGLRFSGGTFQKAVNQLLSDHLRYAFSYVDDTSIYSNSFEDHLIHVDNVLTTYESAGLTCSISKCQIAKPKVIFLGHCVGSGELSVVVSKVEAIDRIPEPSTKKAVRSFIGALNFYNKFIANYSERVRPLLDCLKKGSPNKVRLREDQVEAFKALKGALKSAPVLIMPNYERPFIIQCDASKYAVGSVLMQHDDKEQLRPIAFTSHKFTETEINWDIVAKEAFAVIHSLRQFQNIVFRCKIILYSDHNPLQFAASNVPKSAKLQRWALELQSFDITIRYINTDENVVADWMSRYTE